jgi:hypothetical protein
LVKAKVDDLARAQRRTIGNALLELAGTAAGLASDVARNHDHYLHDTPRLSVTSRDGYGMVPTE